MMSMQIIWQEDMGNMIQPVIIVALKRKKNINESWPAESSPGSSFWIKTHPLTYDTVGEGGMNKTVPAA